MPKAQTRHDLLAGDLRVDDRLQASAVLVPVVGQVQRLLERLDHLPRELGFLGLDRRRHRIELVDRVDAAHLRRVMQRVHHDAALERADGGDLAPLIALFVDNAIATLLIWAKRCRRWTTASRCPR